jgi:hypothetical protein
MLRRGRLEDYREILDVALPASINIGLGALISFCLLDAAFAAGLATGSAMGVALRIESWVVSILFGFGTAVVTLAGRAAGSGDLREGKRVLVEGCFWMTGLAAAIAGIPLFAAPGEALKVFGADTAAASLLRWQGIFLPFLGLALGRRLPAKAEDSRCRRWRPPSRAWRSSRRSGSQSAAGSVNCPQARLGQATLRMPQSCWRSRGEPTRRFRRRSRHKVSRRRLAKRSLPNPTIRS